MAEEEDKIETTDADAAEEMNQAAIDASNEFDKLIDGEQDDEDSVEQAEEGADADAGAEIKKDTDEADAGAVQQEVISDDLLTKAIRAGLDLADARSFTSSTALEKTISLIEAGRGDMAQANATQEVHKQSSFKPFEFKPLEIKFEDEQSIDPEIVKNTKAVAEHYNAQVHQMNQHYQQLFGGIAGKVVEFQQTIQKAETAVQEEKFENCLAGLETDYAKVFGTGRGDEMETTTAEFQNRVKLWKEMQLISKGYEASNKAKPPVRIIFEKALQSAFGNDVKSVASKKVTEALDKRSKLITHPAGHRSGKPLTRQEQAVKKSEEFDQKVGL